MYIEFESFVFIHRVTPCIEKCNDRFIKGLLRVGGL